MSGAEAGKAKVLIVDDEEVLRRTMARVVARAGHEVFEANGGLQATELLGRERFDVVVSDIAMPDMDGIQLLQSVRARDPDVPVILVTGAPDIRTAVDAVEYGAYRYLPKPFELDEFRLLVQKAIVLCRVARVKRQAIELSGEGLGWSDRAGLEASFARALDTMWVAYQPIVRVSERKLFGYEALLRSGEPSLPHPGAVLDAAERLERIEDLGRLIRDRATLPMGDDPKHGLLFVNLHPRDLMDETLRSPDSPLSRIAERVVLEITERASLTEVQDVRSRIVHLRRLGFRIAVDDLGAGYAGLTSFAQLEPDVVKLDMSLVRDVDTSETKQRIIRSMTKLCKDLGILVVAEGVESVGERDSLVDLGCDLLQGYLFARPGRPFPEFLWG